MILFSTLTSCTIYFIYGTLNWQYGLWTAVWCATAAQVVLFFINMIVKKMQRQSIILVFLCFILVVTALLVPIFGSLDAQKA